MRLSGHNFGTILDRLWLDHQTENLSRLTHLIAQDAQEWLRAMASPEISPLPKLP